MLHPEELVKRFKHFLMQTFPTIQTMYLFPLYTPGHYWKFYADIYIQSHKIITYIVPILKIVFTNPYNFIRRHCGYKGTERKVQGENTGKTIHIYIIQKIKEISKYCSVRNVATLSSK
jgi:hypothetical protein